MPSLMTIVPESKVASANTLAGITGLSVADYEAYNKAPKVQDANGSRYRWNATSDPAYIAAMKSRIQSPLGNSEAQALLDSALWLDAESLAESQPVPDIANRLALIRDMEPADVLAVFGLVEAV